MTFVILTDADHAEVPGIEPGGMDFVGLARSMGWEGHLMSDVDDLGDALRTSLADDRPTLVHVPVAGRSHKLY